MFPKLKNQPAWLLCARNFCNTRLPNQTPAGTHPTLLSSSSLFPITKATAWGKRGQGLTGFTLNRLWALLNLGHHLKSWWSTNKNTWLGFWYLILQFQVQTRDETLILPAFGVRFTRGGKRLRCMRSAKTGVLHQTQDSCCCKLGLPLRGIQSHVRMILTEDKDSRSGKLRSYFDRNKIQ